MDFGLSKFQKDILQVTRSVIGTNGYTSPEMLTGLGHNYLTDAYSLGVFIYDLLHGSVPIRSLKLEMYDESTILELHKTITFKEDLSPEAKDILQRLLSTDPKHRLLGDNDIKALLFHPWLKNYQQFVDSTTAPEPVHIPDLDKLNFEETFNARFGACVKELEGTLFLPRRRHKFKKKERKLVLWVLV